MQNTVEHEITFSSFILPLEGCAALKKYLDMRCFLRMPNAIKLTQNTLCNINFILKAIWNMKKSKGLTLPHQKSFYAIGAFSENDWAGIARITGEDI